MISDVCVQFTDCGLVEILRVGDKIELLSLKDKLKGALLYSLGLISLITKLLECPCTWRLIGYVMDSTNPDNYAM